MKSGDQSVAREEVDDADLAEELDRRHEQRDDDPDRRRHRDERAEGEDALDDVLAPVPSLSAQPGVSRLRVACCHLPLARPRRSRLELVGRFCDLLVGKRDELRLLGELRDVVEVVAKKPWTSGRLIDSFFT